jgi:SagB-type dehydrogenase family enzyme
MKPSQHLIELPKPSLKGAMAVEEALAKRRSVREYSDLALTLNELSQLLWAAQGLTSSDGHRTAPSAGALYPLELYVVVGKVDGLSSGVYKYRPSEHELSLLASGDKRPELYRACLEQDFIAKAAVSIVFAAVYERATGKYGERGRRYVHYEVGHAAQNVYLQATALHLGSVVVGAFQDDRVRKVVQLARDEEPLYVMPVGKA